MPQVSQPFVSDSSLVKRELSNPRAIAQRRKRLVVKVRRVSDNQGSDVGVPGGDAQGFLGDARAINGYPVPCPLEESADGREAYIPSELRQSATLVLDLRDLCAHLPKPRACLVNLSDSMPRTQRQTDGGHHDGDEPVNEKASDSTTLYRSSHRRPRGQRSPGNDYRPRVRPSKAASGPTLSWMGR